MYEFLINCVLKMMETKTVETRVHCNKYVFHNVSVTKHISYDSPKTQLL